MLPGKGVLAVAKKSDKEVLPHGPLKAAIYVRVSTRDKQSLDNQLGPCRDMVQSRGWEVFQVYEDRESGSSSDRKGFNRLMRDAKDKVFQVVVVWSLDRFTREGVGKTLNYLDQLTEHGVGFLSVTESYLDTLGAFREVILALLAVIAKQERVRIRERVKAGLTLARARGVKVGRPSRPIPWETVDSLRAAGMGLAAVAKEVGVPLSTLCRGMRNRNQDQLNNQIQTQEQTA